MKRWLLFLLLVVAVGLPGLLLLQFAITDARDYHDPWLKLAVPFLAASAIFMVLCGRARGGRAAIVGATLALVLAGSSFWRVHSAIAARAEQRATGTAIMDLGRVCSAKAPKDLAPTPLPTSRALPVYELDKDDTVRIAIDPAFKPWYPARVSDVTLVACIRYTRTKVETCNYEAGAVAVRFRRHTQITIMDTTSGAAVATVKLTGEPPHRCSDQETFAGHFKDIEGAAPSTSQIADALRPFVTGAR
jgi:hypothetical protein